jgi:hypothetical protein
MTRLALLLAAALLAASPARAADEAVLQGLDKVTARISRLEAPLDQPVKFGTLSIVVKACRKRPPEEPPESAAFLQIDETRPGDAGPTRVFSGWMFASSPALSALDHPVYDVGVLDCRIETTSTGSSRKK